MTPPPEARLPGGEVVLLFALTIVVAAALPYLPGGILGQVVAQQVVAVGGASVLTVALARLSWRQVLGGVSREPRVWVGVVLGGVGWALVQAPLLSAWGAAIGASPPSWWHQSTRGDSLGAYAAMAVSLAVIPPITEELFFRGVFQTRLAVLGPVVATVVPGVVFAVYHIDPYGLPVQLASGVALGALRVRGGGVAVPILAHALNNVIGVVELARDRGPLLSGLLALALGGALLAAGIALLWRRGGPSSALHAPQ